MKKIKILYGLEAAGGGALKHLTYLSTKLDRNTFDITVVLSSSREEDISLEMEKMKVAGTRVLIFSICRGINPVKDLGSLFKLVVLLARERFDIVHAHSSKAGALFRVAAWICSVPKIYYTPHCFYFQGKKGMKKLVFVLLERMLSKITSMVIVSEGEHEQCIRHKAVSIEKLVNINNAIDFDEYRQDKENAKMKTNLGIPANTFVVGAIGRLTQQKDWETYVFMAVEVLKTHPDVRFLIIGEGELYGEIRKLIYKLGLERKVMLTGHVREIHKLYGIIDVYVNTSLWEGLPYVFLEAMKYGKPIVATDTGNGAAIVNGENGFISPVKDYCSIAERVVLLINDRQMVLKMGEKGVNRLTVKYSFERFIKQHERLYLKGISGSTGASG